MFEAITYQPVYLYSWQGRDATKTEFTVVKDNGELGLNILYVILDKRGRILSSIKVAGKGSESGYWFETRSRFTGKDTLLQTAAVTQWYDFDKRQEMEQKKGDTTFSYLVISKSGDVNETIYKEVKHLCFDER